MLNLLETNFLKSGRMASESSKKQISFFWKRFLKQAYRNTDYLKLSYRDANKLSTYD